MALILLAALAYTGFVKVDGQVLDCSLILNRYVHGGIPSAAEDERVKLCCRSVRALVLQGESGDLLQVHLNVCRQLGR